MLVTIILTILGILFCRYLLPMIILSIAGAISRNDEMTNANKQNITSARSNGYQFSALHIIERMLIYADMVCIFMCLFFPKICFPFAIALLVLLSIQVFECVFAIKSGSAYTWIYVSLFGRRGNMNSGGMYNNNMYGNVGRRGLFGRNNQYNGYGQSYNGYNQSGYGYNNQRGYGYGYNNQQGCGYNNQIPYNQQNQQFNNQGNRRSNKILGGIDENNIGVNGKRPADGNIQGWPVWAVNGSKKCFITERGRLIYKLTYMASIDGKNVSDDTSRLIYEFVGDSVDDVCKTLPRVNPVLMVNIKGTVTKRLYITDSGDVCKSAFDDSAYPAIKELENGIIIRNPDTNYYVAERETKSNVVLSNINVTDNGYEFVTLNDDGQLEKYKLDSEYVILTINGKSIAADVEKTENKEHVDSFNESDSDESVDIVTGIKEAISNLPSKSSLKVTVQNLAKVKLAGFGNDGVYNDGTVDVMCEFGELMIIDEKSSLPNVQAIVLSKLIPAMNVDDIMRRIGDGWTDSKLGDMLDDACATIAQQIEAKESQCLNYWITDDKDVYYLSFVFNGNEVVDSALVHTIYNICKKCFIKVNITVDSSVGYRCSMYPADKSKFVKDGDNVDGQSYFNINPINTTPDLFNKYLAPVQNGAEQFKRVVNFTGLTFKARVLECMSYESNNSSRFGYCCKTYLNKSFLFDWERNKSIVKNKVRSSVATPAKIRDILNSSVKDNFYSKYAPVFAIAYGSEEDMLEVNFLFGTAEYTKDELYNSLFNTPLMTYACYDRLDNYLLDSSRDKDVFIILFKKKES